MFSCNSCNYLDINVRMELNDDSRIFAVEETMIIVSTTKTYSESSRLFSSMRKYMGSEGLSTATDCHCCGQCHARGAFRKQVSSPDRDSAWSIPLPFYLGLIIVLMVVVSKEGIAVLGAKAVHAGNVKWIGNQMLHKALWAKKEQSLRGL